MITLIKNLSNAALQAGQSFGQDKTPRLAAALSFYALLSMAPLLIFTVSAFGALFGQAEVQLFIVETVHQFLGADVAELALTLMEDAPRQLSSPIANLISIGVTLYAASGIFGQLYDALNTLWKIPQQSGEVGIFTFVRKRVVGTLMILAGAFLVMGVLLTRTAVNLFGDRLIAHFPNLEILLNTFNQTFFFFAFFVLFILLLKLVPDAYLTWRDAAIGSLFTTILFTIGEVFISIYLAYVAFTSVYGAAATILVILLWVYYSAQIVLFGASFTYAFAYNYGRGITPHYKVNLPTPRN